MPIHDWTRVDAGLFHHFHKHWAVTICDTLNREALPGGYVALATANDSGSTTNTLSEDDIYAGRPNRVTIQHRHGKVAAVVEIVSPGNKNSRHGLVAFVRKTSELIWQGINLLVVDLFPPSERDPQGIHKAIWDEIADRPFELPADKPLTVAAYHAAPVKRAYVEPVAVGDELPELPLFLDEGLYVPAPLEATYRVAWDVFPDDFKDLLEPTTNEGG